jgi:conjugative transposon TraM protein
MKKQAKTPKMIRQRRFLLVLPLLALPFMTMIFWALGGGKVQKAEAQVQKQEGFNIKLPDAILKDNKPMNKMSYYDQAQLDSARFRELIKNDPNYKNLTLSEPSDYLSGQSGVQELPEKRGLNNSLYGSGGYNDPNEEKIYRKLAELDKEMNKPVNTTTEASYDYAKNTSNIKAATVGSENIDRLEQMMDMMNQSNEEDPELQQLNGMLEKILDVQHPERVQEKLRQTSQERKDQVFAVSAKADDIPVSLLDANQISGSQLNGFYSLDNEKNIEQEQNAIRAVIHETQTVVDGSTVKLRLINDIFINGVRIPKDHFLFGIASLNGERLSIKIKSIVYNNSLFPVELSVYDMDGLDGIYIPGAITRDVAKQSADRSMQTIGLTSLDPSWGAQAAGAGIEAARTLFSKKVKLVKVTVKAGYQVLLYDEKQNQSN